LTEPGETSERVAKQDGTPQSRNDWMDPNVPAGDAPALPRWPLVVSALAFCGWLAFLVSMAALRVKTTAM
jgi:hypothetical protein